MIPFPMQMQTIGTGQNPMAAALRQYRQPDTMIPGQQPQNFGMLVKPTGAAVGNSGPDSMPEQQDQRVLQSRNQMMGSLLRRR